MLLLYKLVCEFSLQNQNLLTILDIYFSSRTTGDHHNKNIIEG